MVQPKKDLPPKEKSEPKNGGILKKNEEPNFFRFPNFSFSGMRKISMDDEVFDDDQPWDLVRQNTFLNSFSGFSGRLASESDHVCMKISQIMLNDPKVKKSPQISFGDQSRDQSISGIEEISVEVQRPRRSTSQTSEDKKSGVCAIF